MSLAIHSLAMLRHWVDHTAPGAARTTQRHHATVGRATAGAVARATTPARPEPDARRGRRPISPQDRTRRSPLRQAGRRLDQVEQLLDGVSGYAICERTPESMGSALAEALTADGVPDGRGAIDRQGLDLESVANRLTAIYREVLA